MRELTEIPAPSGQEEARAAYVRAEFEKLGLIEPLLRAVHEEGYLEPMPVQVEAMYDPSKERLREPNYSLDLRLSKVKRCL